MRATDAAGNTDATPASYTWTIDTAAPNTTITAQPSDPSNSAAPDFSFSSSEGGSTFECQLDGGGWASCSSPKSYAGLSQGSHTFEVRATDAAGNTDATPASFTWTIDTTAPASVVTFPAAGGVYNSAAWADIAGTASDGVALDKVEVSIKRIADNKYWNGTAFADGSENWRLATGTAVLVARLPERQLPGRRQLRRSRPRNRHGREPRDAERVLADLRHRGAEHDDHRAAGRPDERDRQPTSPSVRARAARPSSASSTAAAGLPAPRPRATPA